MALVDRIAWIIYNPAAGPCQVARDAEQVRRFWDSQGWHVVSRRSEAPGHAAELARQAVASHCELVFAAGGDGTVGQIAHGLAGSTTVLAVLPIGTANAFAKLLNIVPPSHRLPPDMGDVCERLINGEVHLIDLGRAFGPHLPESGHCFVSWAGAGLDGYIVGQVEPRPKWIKQLAGGRLGWLSYALVGLSSAVRFPGVDAEVQVDDQTVSGTYLLALVSNSRLYGGGLVRLASDACLDDELLDVWLFEGKVFGETLGHAARLLTARHLMNSSTIRLRGRHVVIRTSQPAAVQLDGEPAGSAPLTAQVEPRALRLLVPHDAPADLFRRSGVPFSR